MAGLLGNIAGAMGNNLAQYAHTRQQQDFQQGIEEQRAARAEKLAQWQRGNQEADMAANREFQESLLTRQRNNQIEDRDLGFERQDAQFEQAQQAAQGQAQQAATDQVADRVRENVQLLDGEISQVRSDLVSVDALDPEERQFKVGQLTDSLEDLSRRLELEVQTAEQYGVTDRAGLRATQMRLREVRQQLAAAREAQARLEQEAAAAAEAEAAEKQTRRNERQTAADAFRSQARQASSDRRAPRSGTSFQIPSDFRPMGQ